MRKILAFITACIMAVINIIPAFAQSSDTIPETTFRSYVVMDAATGQVLLEKEMDLKAYPASITKILTTMLALENKSPDDQIIISYEAVHSILAGSTHIALTEGEVITLRDALYATMIQSANDAANVAGEHTGGSLAAFAEMMNKRAAELGAVNTHFVNANGLPHPDHYTTAYDMALITRAALNVDGFRDYFGALLYTMPPTNKQTESRTFGTFHHMLVDSKYYYDGAVGGKLGWTEEAKHTIVTVAKRGDIELICVGMNTGSKWGKYSDTAKLFDYCFNNLKPFTLKGRDFEEFEVPVYEDDKSNPVYTAKISGAGSYSLLIHRDLDEDDVLSFKYNIPEYYSDPDKINPTVTIKLNDPNGRMVQSRARLPLEYELIPLADGGTGASGISMEGGFSLQKVKEICIVLLKVAGVMLGVLFVLLLIIRQINLYRYRKIREKMNRQQHRTRTRR
ncbi:MAG: D-alanyl-D-alanine carboxypeptidase [Oscillospiraceae bacterium]|nr:D-alanyl-D-alanine carboxypeptidase [Oscillospiraceae bacterium]